ncbi:MAG: 50S ribosomal protein L6 [Candidatus Liptonbacteria bacterium]|nr:50S ribosomal protein L6 [Candidatus Liptonbacteria bacterium]
MSRLAKKPIKLTEGVTVKDAGGKFVFKGAKGEHAVRLLQMVKADLKGDELIISKIGNSKQASANTGTMVALIRNAMEGVSTGFTKVLEIEGVGFRATMEGNTIVLSLGFANPIKLPAPEGITIVVEKSLIKITGVDRGLVGQVAANIRAMKKPEPYKGKGIHYLGEVIPRKVGKKAGAATTS